MMYVPYDSETLQKQKKQRGFSGPTEYIFMLDSSSSMRGTPWEELMKSLREILAEISGNPSATASIILFNGFAKTIYTSMPCSKIDTMSI